MRNHNHDRKTLKPLPFDPLSGLEVIEPHNKMELERAWQDYQQALLMHARANLGQFGGLLCPTPPSQ